LLLAFFVGLSAVLREAVGKASLTEILVFGYGVATAALLALVGLFETVTVYVGRTPAHSALAAPLWMLTQTTIMFLYFFGSDCHSESRHTQDEGDAQLGRSAVRSLPYFLRLELYSL
jgi:hypothetical protein